MPLIELTDLHDPRLRVFSSMTDAELRDPKQLLGLALATEDKQVHAGLFIAESKNVIDRALASGLTPFALLTEERWREAGEEILLKAPGTPLFVGTHAQIRELTGFERTRGPLAAFYRPTLPQPQELLRTARRVAILENITNFTNIGAIFRSAAALGMDAVLVTPGCHDPFYRRAARVSMGTVFQVPWCRIGEGENWAEKGIPLLKSLGFTTAAMALEEDSIRLQDPRIANVEKLALILGTEGEGLSPTTVAACDYTVCIPMEHGVDSLNVGAAAAIAFWETAARSPQL